jgi:hypothetical protein
MGRLRPHLNTIPLIVRSRGAKNPQISVLYQPSKRLTRKACVVLNQTRRIPSALGL